MESRGNDPAPHESIDGVSRQSDNRSVDQLFTLGDLLEASADRVPERIALTDGAREFTYHKLREVTDRVAGGLRAAGVERGDRVAILIRQTIDCVIAIWAVNKAGAVFVIVDPRLLADQVSYRCSHSGAKLVVVDPDLRSLVTGLAQITIDEASVPRHSVTLPTVIGSDLGAILYTSGSTGMPKGAVLSNENLVMGARIVSQYLKLTADDVLLAVLPFHFDYGLNQLTTAALVGATLALPASTHPRHIASALRELNVTGLAGVPPLWIQLLHEHSPFRKGTFPALRYMTNSGGALPIKYVELLRSAFPQAELYLMYGLTEAFRSTFLPPSELAAHMTSMGKAIPNVEIVVVREDGSRCAPGEIGELVHRGGVIFQGYWRDEEATKRVLRPPPGTEPGRTVQELAVWSGDYVTADDDGFLYFHGRRDEQIKSSGYRISPQEVETIVQRLSAVSEVVAFAVPDEALGSVIRIVVSLHDDARLEAKELLDHCRQHMPPYMVPRDVVFIPALPRGMSGKIDRAAVKSVHGA